jgi:hypothetical protein
MRHHLTQEGKSCFIIEIPPQASLALNRAARELSTYIERVTGARVPVRSVSGPEPVIKIALTDDDRLRGSDGFRFTRQGDKLAILAATGRGALYGVYAWIEQVLGVRFLTPDEEYLPRRSDVALPEFPSQPQLPAFPFRENQWYEACCSSALEERNADFAVKSANLGSMCPLDESRGGNVVYPGSHTFDTLCPSEEYFGEHPEYYALVNGVRIGHPRKGQLCLTHPDVLRIVTDNLLQTIRANPDRKIFAVAQNDCYGWCECPRCAQIDAEEGSHAGTLIRFVNAVAQAVEEEFPDVIIDTLAYQYTRQAPRLTRPRHNVVVRICTIESCLSHPLRNCQAINATFANRTDVTPLNRDLADWGKITSHYNCWTYVTNFAHYLAPVPNLWVLADNLRFFREMGVTDMRLQGNRQSASGEMGGLRAYVSGKLLWDPYRSDDKLIREFCVGYYKMAAGPILAYLRMVNQAAAAPDVHAGLYDSPWAAPYLAGDFLPLARDYFARARALADDEEILRRVEKAALSVEYVAMAQRLPGLSPEAARREVDAFAQKAACYGITYLSETGEDLTGEELLEENKGRLLRAAEKEAQFL